MLNTYSPPQTGMRYRTPNSSKRHRTVENGASGEAKIFSLTRIYPNPFFSVATIAFTLAAAAYVRLELLTNAGEPLHLFLDKWLASGSHKVIIDGEALRLRSGGYSVKLSCNNGKANASCSMPITVR